MLSMGRDKVKLRCLELARVLFTISIVTYTPYYLLAVFINWLAV